MSSDLNIIEGMLILFMWQRMESDLDCLEVLLIIVLFIKAIKTIVIQLTLSLVFLVLPPHDAKPKQ